jgi:hypothetical protein
MAQSYFYAGEREAGIAASLTYAKEVLQLTPENNPDVIVFRYGLFSVDDARRVIRIADQMAVGQEKIMVIAPERIFHEAQNALLKMFEEPPPGTTLVLIVPAVGNLLGTLRSRMQPLSESGPVVSTEAQAFLAASGGEREKIISKLLDRAKSDKDDEKQAARGEALRLAEGLQLSAYASLLEKEHAGMRAFASDLDRFIPILYERSAPLKPIFEHLMLTLPRL